MIGTKDQSSLKKNGTSTLTKSLFVVKKAIGSIAKAFLLILLVLSTCTCSGLKLTWGQQIFASQTGYSTYSGRLVNRTVGVTECAILRTDGLDLVSWHHPTQLTRQQFQEMLGLEYSLSLELMLRKCSLIKLYPYQSITPSFLNQYRTEWNVQRQNYHTRYLRKGSRVIQLKKQRKTYRRVLTPRSTGRTQGTTPMMERNSSSSSTMNRVNGRDQTTSSTTGGLRKQR